MAIIHQDSDEDSDEVPNEADWNSDDEPPEENEGDERILSRDADAKKVIRLRGRGLACPGEHDVVCVKYQVMLADQVVAESSNPEGDTVVLGENRLPLAVEMCVRRMHKAEKADAICAPRYAAIASPLYGQPLPKDKKIKKKFKFLPVPPDSAVPPEGTDPEAEVRAHVELLSFEAVAVLTDDGCVRKKIIRKGRGWRNPRLGDVVFFSYGTDGVEEEKQQRVSCSLTKETLPYPGLYFILTSMKRDEHAHVSLGGHHRGTEAADADATVALTCTLHRFLHTDKIKVERQSGAEDTNGLQFDKRGLRPSPDAWTMHSVSENCPVLLCMSGSSGHVESDGNFAIATWTVGEDAVPDYIEAAAKSLKLHEYSEFNVPAEIIRNAPSLLCFDGQSRLKQVASDSKIDVLLSRLTAEYNGEDPLCNDASTEEGISASWVTEGDEVCWPDFAEAAGARIAEDGSLCFRMVLIAVREAPDSWALDEEQQIVYIARKRHHGNALVKNSRFAEAYTEYKNALDACRMTALYKKFLPTERGTMTATYSRDPSELEDPVSKLTAKEAEDAKIGFLAIHLNLALCAMRREDFNECRHQCDVVIAADPNNVKALFRRACASQKLGEYKFAEKDLCQALELQPNDKGIVEELKRLKLAMKKHMKSEKAMYAKLFAPVASEPQTAKGASDTTPSDPTSEASSSN
eukprot:gnl/MRDRNA2_/MRDRNA2_27396_c0_seq1.p1 gnl/MRDRNA2_/MRDRNA2_27396_c0~~gnl/MRDRNA2_/MRDRNA2_27396_c0_seq1.p1  ORF type:complete len:690 (+),score=155.49 gnl/MRDRNA2_/MRDRNA2_27396_c0_seq1:72-2141(+)